MIRSFFLSSSFLVFFSPSLCPSSPSVLPSTPPWLLVVISFSVIWVWFVVLPDLRRQGTMRKCQGWSEGWGTVGKNLCCVFSREGRESRVSRFRVGCLNNFNGLWGSGAAPARLVPGHGVIRAGGRWPRVWEPNDGSSWVRALEQLVCIRTVCPWMSCFLSLGIY